MIENLKQISDSEWVVSGTTTINIERSKSIVFEGETYSRKWFESEEFDFDVDFKEKNGEYPWRKITFNEMAFLGVKRSIWDYCGFEHLTRLDRILMHKTVIYSQNQYVQNFCALCELGFFGDTVKNPGNQKYFGVHQGEFLDGFSGMVIVPVFEYSGRTVTVDMKIEDFLGCDFGKMEVYYKRKFKAVIPEINGCIGHLTDDQKLTISHRLLIGMINKNI